MKRPGNAVLHQIEQQMLDANRLLFGKEKEIARLFLLDNRHVTGVDAVRIDDDLALLRLPEQVSQPNGGNGLAAQQVAQNIARPDGGKLVSIDHQQQVRIFRQRLEQIVEQEDIDHRELVDDDEFVRSRLGLVAQPAVIVRSIL